MTLVDLKNVWTKKFTSSYDAICLVIASVEAAKEAMPALQLLAAPLVGVDKRSASGCPVLRMWLYGLGKSASDHAAILGETMREAFAETNASG